MGLLTAPVSPLVITSGFGSRRDPLSGAAKAIHPGIDCRAAVGQKVVAAAAGTVTRSALTRGDEFAPTDRRKRWYSYGELICIVHHALRLETRYAHLSGRLVHVGEVVCAGQVIGYAGQSGDCTGPHLHFEVRSVADTLASPLKSTPVDPLPLL